MLLVVSLAGHWHQANTRPAQTSQPRTAFGGVHAHQRAEPRCWGHGLTGAPAALRAARTRRVPGCATAQTSRRRTPAAGRPLFPPESRIQISSSSALACSIAILSPVRLNLSVRVQYFYSHNKLVNDIFQLFFSQANKALVVHASPFACHVT
jgi:hypothetical protein